MNTTPVSLLQKLRSPQANTSWPRFVDLYTPLLYHWATQRLKLSRQDALDFLQDVFVKLLRKLPELEYDPNRRFRGWLWTLVVNEWRQHQRRHALPVGDASDGALEETIAVPPDRTLEEEEYRKFLVARALDLMRTEFHPTTWQACWALVVEGRPAAEVAAERNMTVNALYVVKSRVLRRLREELAGLFD
jgi:RNA polymerase sigma-70 factor (ECF subfamily)